MTELALPSADAARRATAAVTQATAIEQARAVAQVQAAVVVAQQVPRDMGRAYAEMRESCGRLAMAQRAFYSVPNRGTGPTVHLARELARIWGNIESGVHELRRDDVANMSEIQAFAWDVQTNSRTTRTYQQPHQTMKGSGANAKRVTLVDLGDVYRNNQNTGARALRECIFDVLPAAFVAEAEQLCRETLERGEGKPLAQRVEDAVGKFAQLGVKAAQLEQRVGKPRQSWTAYDLSGLTILYTSLQRGDTTVAEEFPAEVVDRTAQILNDRAPASAPAPPVGEPMTTSSEPAPAADAPHVEDPPERSDWGPVAQPGSGIPAGRRQ